MKWTVRRGPRWKAFRLLLRRCGAERAWVRRGAYRGPEGLYLELSGKGFTGTTKGGSGELTVGMEF